MRSKQMVATGMILAAALVGIVVGQTYDPGAELAVIERVVKARADYKAGLTELVNLYLRAGDITGAKRAEKELDALGTIEQYDYARETAGPVVEAPIKLLKYVPEADDYYTDGVIIMESRRKSRKDIAMKRFEKVLENWPDSDKAPKAAYQMGEVYAGVYYRDHDLAAKYYKKCYELDNATEFPALVKAADMYLKLGRTDDAIAMYKLAIEGSRDITHKEEAEKALRKLAVEGF